MSAKLFLQKQEEIGITKKIQPDEAIEIIKKIEIESGLEILKRVKDIQSKKADSFSIDKDEPRINVFICNGSGTIKVNFETKKKMMKLSLPENTEIFT